MALVEAMWQVAYADNRLAADERHLITKIADLLHVTHEEHIAAKMRAKEDAMAPLSSGPVAGSHAGVLDCN